MSFNCETDRIRRMAAEVTAPESRGKGEVVSFFLSRAGLSDGLPEVIA